MYSCSTKPKGLRKKSLSMLELTDFFAERNTRIFGREEGISCSGRRPSFDGLMTRESKRGVGQRSSEFLAVNSICQVIPDRIPHDLHNARRLKNGEEQTQEESQVFNSCEGHTYPRSPSRKYQPLTIQKSERVTKRVFGEKEHRTLETERRKKDKNMGETTEKNDRMSTRESDRPRRLVDPSKRILDNIRNGIRQLTTSNVDIVSEERAGNSVQRPYGRAALAPGGDMTEKRKSHLRRSAVCNNADEFRLERRRVRVIMKRFGEEE